MVVSGKMLRTTPSPRAYCGFSVQQQMLKVVLLTFVRKNSDGELLLALKEET